MGKRRTILIGGLAIIAVVAGTVAVRTATFAPNDIADGTDIRLAAVPTYNLDTAVANLSAAAQIRTISHQDPADDEVAEWDRLHAWLAATYPDTHRAMTRTILPNRTLIYHWPGSDASLAPIIVMAHQDVVPVTEGTEGDWKYPPFAGTIAEKAVWGRGTVDDKGSLVGLFEALEALAGQGFQPKRGIYLVSGHDEEVGGSGAVAAAAKLKAEGVTRPVHPRRGQRGADATPRHQWPRDPDRGRRKGLCDVESHRQRTRWAQFDAAGRNRGRRRWRARCWRSPTIPFRSKCAGRARRWSNRWPRTRAARPRWRSPTNGCSRPC